MNIAMYSLGCLHPLECLEEVTEPFEKLTKAYGPFYQEKCPLGLV